MVMPLDVEVLENQPGEVEAEDNLKITYKIISIKAARVGDGYYITVAGIDTTARFKRPPQQAVVACNTPR